ncbi:MAG: ATP-dependent DNA ligase [Actinomycetota bacterium]|nr:ATP-dependent DNA ligase [Actinomycetota bacterium]
MPSKETISVDGIDVEVSHPDKELFGDGGATKGDLARYYARVGSTMVAHTAGRPLTMVRHPNGIGGKGFFQKDAPDYFPDWIERVELDKKGGHVNHVVADRFVVDLDPSTDEFDRVRRAAQAVADLFEEIGLRPYVQTTGSSGLHVVTPLDRSGDYGDAQRFAGGLAHVLLERHPDDLTTEFHKKKRGDRIYLDLGRNGYAATMAAPYGVRPKPNAPVATPIDWDEVDDPDLGPRRYTITNVFDRLDAHGDPWADIDDHAEPIAAAGSRLAELIS